MTKNFFEYRTVRDMVSRIYDTRSKALCTTTYGTGARVGEVIQLVKEDIVLEEEHLLISLPTLKNRLHPRRIIPIHRKNESWVIEPILKWKELCDTDKLFNFSSRRARHLIQKELKVHPHFLRHSRLTHLVKIWQFDSHRLQLFAGWSNPKPAQVYVHLDWKDIAKKFDF
jgi:integrase